MNDCKGITQQCDVRLADDSSCSKLERKSDFTPKVSRSNVTLLCAWLYSSISGFRLVDADFVLTGKDESTDVAVEEVFFKALRLSPSL